MSELYDNPKYYEIAFSFRDIKAEVDLFEECYKRYSKIPVKTVLELGCGNCPHMAELAKRGYQYSGLDLNKAMLAYSRQKAQQANVDANLIFGDMIDFSLEYKVDFVYTLLGSLHVRNNSELKSHFGSVKKALRKGGLYFLDWCIQYDPPGKSEGSDSWEMKHDGIGVKTTVAWKSVSFVEQTFEETITLEIDDHGDKKIIVGKEILKAMYPQEFLCFISNLDGLEFVGWWNNWDLNQPLEKARKIDRPIALVRRI